MTKPGLDTLIARARQVDVRPDHAHAYLGELARWGRHVPERPRRPFAWLAGAAFAVAVAALMIVILRRPSAAPSDAPVRLGDRVAVIAEPGTAYRVVAAELDRTEIVVEHGTVTARLFPGVRRHALALRGGGLEATATGTVYTLAVDDHGVVVAVHEGTVAVHRGVQQATVGAQMTWPPSAKSVGVDAAGRLLAMSAPTVLGGAAPAQAITPVPSPTPTPAAPTKAVPADATIVQPKSPPVAPKNPPPLTARWRAARLYRAQGNFDDAIAECLAIADARDETWSPIALVEAARIELGPRVQPERTIALVDRFEREWPKHSLGPEARELRCRAMRQLGRAGACTPSDAGP